MGASQDRFAINRSEGIFHVASPGFARRHRVDLDVISVSLKMSKSTWLVRSGTACLILPLLLAEMGQQAFAQRAGLWEERGNVDGKSVGTSVRECRGAGAQLAVLQAWPANCAVKPLHHTASGMMTEARCATPGTGVSLSLVRKLTGNLDRYYEVATSSRIDGASPIRSPHHSTVTFRYLGPCAGAGYTASGSDVVVRSYPSREPLPVTLIRMVAPVLIMGSIVATGWFFRRRWRNRYGQATVANIVTDAAGATTVPVLVTYTGLRGLPWWYAIAMNNAKPLLVVESDGICFRVIRRQRRAFSGIACVDVRQGPGTVNLDFTFHGSVFTFAANVGSVALAAHVIALLPPGIPRSLRAQAVGATA